MSKVGMTKLENQSNFGKRDEEAVDSSTQKRMFGKNSARSQRETDLNQRL